MKKLAIGAMALGLFLAAPAAMTAQAAGPGYTEKHQHAVVHQRAVRQQRAVKQERVTQHQATFVAHERRSIQATKRVRTHAVQATQRANYATQRANYATQRANRATNRADFAVYRANVRSAQRYHWNNYQRPSGWYAHRWTYGERLPTAFYASNYWIGSYVSFGLMAPPSGLVWVREDNDALLIDRNTGEIERVEYDVFY